MTNREDQDIRYWLTDAGWAAANAAAAEVPDDRTDHQAEEAHR